MTFLQAILLGLLQGATEFLPVSSSGHLFLAQKLLGLRGPELAFDTLLHLGTLAAVVLFLRAEIAGMAASLVGRRGDVLWRSEPWGRREAFLLIVSTIPTGAIGLAFRDTVERGLTLAGMGGRYLVLTVLLLASSLRLRHKFDPERIEVWEALAIGTVQGLAVFPGLSRSGSTITLALLLGIGAARSAKYSFLISLPAILGAAAVNLAKGMSTLPPPGTAAAGFVTALAAGYAALALVERLVTRGRFARFAPYTLFLALVCFYLSRHGVA